MTPDALYLVAAEAAAERVIGVYSTSFGLASRLLGARERRDVGNIYALVRVADEIVDGVGTAAGLDSVAVTARLDEYERETLRAVQSGYSTDLIVHAFAATARRVGFGAELIEPFFSSMRSDITQREYDEASFAEYIYGSAEVVGLMCLHSFLEGRRMSTAQRARFDRGARALGAAFQKVNFLRDLAADFGALGRSYFPGVAVESFDEATKRRLLDDLDRDLATAARVIPSLPRGSRRAVAAAHGLFAELSTRIRATPADELVRSRTSVPSHVKAAVLIRAVIGGR